jgi:hypothetical protein
MNVKKQVFESIINRLKQEQHKIRVDIELGKQKRAKADGRF